MKKLRLLSLGLILAASPALAADLGARRNSDSGSADYVAPVSSSWTGFTIGVGVGHNSTEHDVQGRRDDSSAKFLNDASFLKRDVYAVTVPGHTIGGECTGGNGCVEGHWEDTTVDTVVYTDDKTAPGAKLWKPEGSIVTADDIGVIGASHSYTAKAGDTFPNGDYYKHGDALVTNGAPAVGYTVDATSFFSENPTGRGLNLSVSLGYDAQMGKQFLVGIMGDYQFRNAKTAFGDSGVEISQSDAVFLGARLGFLPTNRLLVYGLAGYTWLSHNDVEGALRAADSITVGENQTYDATYGDGSFGGLTLGGGVEYKATDAIRVGLEARNTWFGKETMLSSVYADSYEHTKAATVITDEPSEFEVRATLKFDLTSGAQSFK